MNSYQHLSQRPMIALAVVLITLTIVLYATNLRTNSGSLNQIANVTKR